MRMICDCSAGEVALLPILVARVRKLGDVDTSCIFVSCIGVLCTCSIANWFWARREDDLVVHDLKDLEVFRFDIGTARDIVLFRHLPPHDSQRFRKLLDFTGKSLVATNVEVYDFHPVVILDFSARTRFQIREYEASNTRFAAQCFVRINTFRRRQVDRALNFDDGQTYWCLKEFW